MLQPYYAWKKTKLISKKELIKVFLPPEQISEAPKEVAIQDVMADLGESERPEISFVIPCYNEEKRMPPTLLSMIQV